jgi:aryl-alcohol dehydrogenase-like predicted oxidoreductase
MFGITDEDAALQSAYRALDAGINFFDNSPFYGKGLAEERLGKVLRGRRQEIIVGTKAGRYGPDEFDFSAERIRRGFEESLRRLGTDYVDILQLHDVEFVDLEGPRWWAEDLYGCPSRRRGVPAPRRRRELSGQPILHPAFRLRHHIDRDREAATP